MTHDGKPVDRRPYKPMTREQHNANAVAYEPKLKAMYSEKVDRKFYGIAFPTWVTPKVEGVRCLTLADGGLVDKTLHPIKNNHIYNTLERYGLGGLDGALTLKGDHTLKEITEAVMRVDGKPSFKYYIFDLWNQPMLTYEYRMKELRHQVTKPHPEEIIILNPVCVYDTEGLLKYWNKCALDGFDGIMMRRKKGYYAWWTHLQGDLKEFTKYASGVGAITGVEEYEYVPGTFRGFKCCDSVGRSFAVRKGYTEKERVFFWDTKTIQIGNKIHFTYQPGDCAPRHPTFVRVEKV